MEPDSELQEFCERGMPITLDAEWDQFSIVKQLLLERYEYETDPEEPNTFIKKVKVGDYSLAAEAELEEPAIKKTIFPTYAPQPNYLPASGDRHGPSESPSWKRGKLIQFDTIRLPVDGQTMLFASIPTKPALERQQRVGIRVAIQPKVLIEQTELLVHLQPKLLYVGVPAKEVFTDKLSLGFYPCFTRLSLYPVLPDPSAVALALYTPRDSVNSDDGPCPVRGVRKTTGTRLGAEAGWGPIKFTAERSWETETEETKDFDKLVPVTSEDGNAASFEWNILRWSEGVRYNARRPLSGFRLKFPKPPFAGGTSSLLRLEKFPGAVWHLDPRLKDSPLRFMVHVEVEMHLVWFLGSNPFIKSPGSDSKSFEFKNLFEVTF